MWWRFGALGLLGLSMTVTSPVSAQSDQERAGARAIGQEAIQAFGEGRWQDALDLFKRAESLVHAPTLVLHIARTHEKLGNLVAAREAYLKIVRETLPSSAPQPFRDAQEAARTEADALEPRVPNVTLKVAGPGAEDAEVTLDGNAIPPALLGLPFPINPGSHRVRAMSKISGSPENEFATAEGERKSLVLTLDPALAPEAPPAPTETEPTPPSATTASPAHDEPPPDSSGGIPVGAYVGFGVAVVGAGIGTVFVLQRAGKWSDADDAFAACDPGCTSTEQGDVGALDRDAADAGTIALVGFSVGAAGLIGGLTFLLLDGGSSETAAPMIRGRIGAGTVEVSGAF